jgi:hypothetical protein
MAVSPFFEGRPRYGVYDAFVLNDTVDWRSHFANGLFLIDHLDIVAVNNKNLLIHEEISMEQGLERRDVHWETSSGVLHEYYLKDPGSSLLPWRMEYFIKDDSDYVLMCEALSGSTFSLKTPGHLFMDPAVLRLDDQAVLPIISMERTPFQKVQLDFTGLEKFAIDLAFENSGLFELVEIMNQQLLDKFELVKHQPVRDIKLWENLSIEVLGPANFRKHLVPVYDKLAAILAGTGKQLHLHLDGKLRLIKDDIARLKLGGIDSLCSGADADVSVSEAVQAWPDSFLWINLFPGWFTEDPAGLLVNVQEIMADAWGSQYCFIISEDVPPYANVNIQAVLELLATDLPQGHQHVHG